MAGTAVVTVQDAVGGSSSRAAQAQVNALVDDVETLRAAFVALLAKLDADGGVDTDYEATLAVDAETLVAAPIEDASGEVA